MPQDQATSSDSVSTSSSSQPTNPFAHCPNFNPSSCKISRKSYKKLTNEQIIEISICDQHSPHIRQAPPEDLNSHLNSQLVPLADSQATTQTLDLPIDEFVISRTVSGGSDLESFSLDDLSSLNAVPSALTNQENGHEMLREPQPAASFIRAETPDLLPTEVAEDIVLEMQLNGVQITHEEQQQSASLGSYDDQGIIMSIGFDIYSYNSPFDLRALDQGSSSSVSMLMGAGSD